MKPLGSHHPDRHYDGQNVGKATRGIVSKMGGEDDCKYEVLEKQYNFATSMWIFHSEAILSVSYLTLLRDCPFFAEQRIPRTCVAEVFWIWREAHARGDKSISVISLCSTWNGSVQIAVKSWSKQWWIVARGNASWRAASPINVWEIQQNFPFSRLS